MTTLSIIVLNWNHPKLTLECLKSIENLKLPSSVVLHVIVIDNNSTDDSENILSKSTVKNATYHFIRNEHNLGFAGGNNVGISHALSTKSDYILILNNDTVLDTNLLGELLKSAEKNTKSILTPKIYFAAGYEFHKKRYSAKQRGKVIWSVGGTIDWNNVYGTNRGVDEVDKGQFEEETEVDFASGACMFFPSEIIDTIGTFDEKYFLYLEDTDFCMRAKQKGYNTLYVPKACLWHKVSQSSEIGGRLNDYFITRNRLLFAQRYAGLRTRFALFRENIRLVLYGRVWQRRGVIDYYISRYGKGSWK